MIRKTRLVAVVLAVCCAGAALAGRQAGNVAAEADPHAYFNALLALPQHWKSWSLRPDGLSATSRWVTYDLQMDAAKVVIPAFYLNEVTHVLTNPLDATETVMTIQSGRKGIFPAGYVLKIDDEVVTVASGGWTSETTIGIVRGSHGTTPRSHAVGAEVLHATNSLRGQVRLPLGTEDGHRYVFVWDARWSESYLGLRAWNNTQKAWVVTGGHFNHKAFQFTSGGNDGDQIWFEPQTLYGRAEPYVATTSFRSYNRPGGDANWLLTDGNMLGPNGIGARTPFSIAVNTWTRWFVSIDQRKDDYDILDVWMADETRDPVHVVKNGQISVRPSGRTPNSIQKFWLEFNSSTDALLRTDQRDLVAYVRNVVAIRNVADVRPLLVKPLPGVEPERGPEPPTNLRILQ